jgi:DNA-binding LytR/AlgR family response regulator
MIRVAICDDDHAMTGHIERLINVLNTEYYSNIRIKTSIYFDGEAFCERQNKDGDIYDIVLMDIEMGTMTGIDAGRKLREHIANEHTILIFISAYDNYFRDLVDLCANGFISKPISPTDFNAKMKNAIDKILRFRQLPQQPYFMFKNKGRKIYIPKHTIMYLQSNTRQIQLRTTSRLYDYYGKMDDEEGKLKSSVFVRIHKSYMINLDHAATVTFTEVTMNDGQILYVSERYRKMFKKAYLKYRMLAHG